jgi:hypothetical protein
MSLEPIGPGLTTPSPADMEIANAFRIACDAEMEHEGFRIRVAGIGKRIGGDLLAGRTSPALRGAPPARTSYGTRPKSP